MIYHMVVDKLRRGEYFVDMSYHNYNNRDAVRPNVIFADFLEDSSNDCFDVHSHSIVNHFSNMKRGNLEVAVCDSQDYLSYMLVNPPPCYHLNGCLSYYPLLSSTLK